MRAISLTLLCLFIFTGLAPALSKDDNRMKTAEQAFKEKRYADAKAVFDDLKDKPVYREKSLLYLAMLYYETGQVESSLEGLKDFNRYVTEATDVSLKTSADNLADEINEGFSTLDSDSDQRPGDLSLECLLNLHVAGILQPAQVG